jgi:hypothetical protein
VVRQRRFSFASRGWARGLWVALVLVACTTYRDNLSRGERLYQENKFQDSLALCRLMERDVDALSRTEQVRYAYLRGMTDYQLGFRSDARHWLAVAWAIHEQEVGGLDASQQVTTKTTLDELNREVYGLVPLEASATSSANPASSAAPSADGFCRMDADCQAAQICVAERCTEP